MSRTLRVGIIGANAKSGWARESHIPAVRMLEGLTLAAIATSNRISADEAAQAFGVPGHADGLALIADPDIDIVTIATRVPDHRAMVLAAIDAGKHVYSEWPLGCGMEESREMAEAAQRAGVHTAIGLQLRESPAVLRAGELLGFGAIGRVLSANGFCSVAGFGPDVPTPYAYLEEPENFANLVTIQGAHMLDLAIGLLGWPERLEALTSRQFPDIRIGAKQHRRTTFDHLLMQGRGDDRVPFSLEVAGNRMSDTPFHLEIVGERGKLRLNGKAPRGLQAGRLLLEHDGKPVAADDHIGGADDGSINVAGVYARLRDDILAGTRRVVGFGHAERLTKVVQSILESGEK